MKLLLTEEALEARGAVARDELSSLARGLRDELEVVARRELYLPGEKALLSRAGGRCERDGSTLEFDPFSPHRHRCPTCGTVHVGELHDRFWIFWYQLWLAERAVHGALLGRLLSDPGALSLASAILELYVDQYLLYPNRDNVLGPTRVFFSTYLESIWLLNLCVALDLLESKGESTPLGARVRERILEPSSAIIASYDEGASNRQVWNDAALLAAARLMGRDADAENAVFGSSGVVYHCQHGLLADGTWYEGENYHLFAHRGLWYGVTMAERAGLELPREARRRFQEGFATPFLTALPDMTLPSRRDSQYAISLRQPRFAELCELGLGRERGEGDTRLRAMLRHLYLDEYPRRDTGRANSTADVERNLPGTSLSRADLGWRSLLFARPQLPPLEGAPLGSVLLEAQGIAVLRRERERVYVALDYGTSGGGHGHPDRLNVLLCDGDTRWLDDMGTGSYVDPSLHWYRSTLAHNAPMFDGRDQERVDGRLLAFEEHGKIGWISAQADGLYPGVVTQRTLVVLQDYAVDELTWESQAPVRMELPLHIAPAALRIEHEEPSNDTAFASDVLPDALGVLSDVSSRQIGARCVARVIAREGDRELQCFILASVASRLFRASAPAAPGRGRGEFLVLAASRASGRQWLRIVWSWAGHVGGIRTDDSGLPLVVERTDGEDRHNPTLGGWQLTRSRGSVEEVIALDGMRREIAPRTPPPQRLTEKVHVLEIDRPLNFSLGEKNYRRSEESWADAGRPTAEVAVVLTGEDLRIGVTVHGRGQPTFVPARAVNPYDNEPPDINGDGVQLYLADALGASAWLLVPESTDAATGTLRHRSIEGWSTPRTIDGHWHAIADGYHVSIRLPKPVVDSKTGRFALGLVVNEKPPGRERRRGQLVLGGGAGEFVYLRGDREDRDRLQTFVIQS